MREGRATDPRNRSDPRSGGGRDERMGCRARFLRSGRSSRRRLPRPRSRPAERSPSRDGSGSRSSRRPSGLSRLCRSLGPCRQTTPCLLPPRERGLWTLRRCRFRGAAPQRMDRCRGRTSQVPDLARARSTLQQSARPRGPPRTRRSGLDASVFSLLSCLLTAFAPYRGRTPLSIWTTRTCRKAASEAPRSAATPPRRPGCEQRPLRQAPQPPRRLRPRLPVLAHRRDRARA